MSIEDILQALDEQCREECRAIFNRAQEEAGRILEKAREEAEEIRRNRLARIRAEAESEATSLLYSARLRAKNAVIGARERVAERALEEAGKHLKDLRSRGDYPAVLEGLLREAVASLGEEAVVHVDPRDRELVEKILRGEGSGFKVVPDLDTAGGVVVTDPEERVKVINTVEERLNRAREKLRIPVYGILFGEGEKAKTGGG
jgi:vacuolar-type H+-ATPase subunit E/Vma4